MENNVNKEFQDYISTYFQYITNIDNTPREFKRLKKVVKRAKKVDRNVLLKVIQNGKDPNFILNNFSGGSIKFR